MNQNTINVLVEKVSSEWKRFARMTHLRDVDSIIDEIDYDPDITEEKFKMERFLMKLYHHHPVDYMNLIEESLKKMPRNDLLKDLGFDMSKSLKKLYLSLYKNREQLLHNCSYPAAVNQTENFIELNMVDANEIASDVICFDEKNYYIQKYSSIKQNFVNCNRVLSTDFDLLLIAGGAGIGKTCFLQKCVLDWANDLIWNTYDYVFYLECRRLNQYKQLKTVNSLLQEFYKDVLNDKEILANKSTLFVVDGLEEFVYLDDLLSSNEDNNPSVHPIVIALEQILSTKKCVVAGRVGAVMAYRKKNKIHREIKFVQIMGFSNDSIENYICKFLKSKADQRIVKEFLEKSRIAKTMASVPFFLSVICSILVSSSPESNNISFQTITQLYAIIFLYFLQRHAQKASKVNVLYKLKKSLKTKDYIRNICKLSYNYLKDGKAILSKKKFKSLNIDKDLKIFESQCFIEGFETQRGKMYQFYHLSLMEFCSAVHIFLNGVDTFKEVWENKHLRSCLPMVCGLYKADPIFIDLLNPNSEIDVYKWLENIYSLKKQSNTDSQRMRSYSGLIGLYFRRIIGFQGLNQFYCLTRSVFRKPAILQGFDEFFVDCFYEAQATVTDGLKRMMEDRWWALEICDGNPLKIEQQKYFYEKFIQAGMKLNQLRVLKNSLSSAEKELFVTCLTNVCDVIFWWPLIIEGWTPIHSVERIWILIDGSYVSKVDFKCYVIPWFQLCKQLDLRLHDRTEFIEDICRWIRSCLNIERLKIMYRGKHFQDTNSLENEINELRN